MNLFPETLHWNWHWHQAFASTQLLHESSSVVVDWALTLGLVLVLCLCVLHTKRGPAKAPVRRPPIVSNSIPFVGHFLQLYRDPVTFLRAAYKRHGPIFQVNIFRKRVVFVCDRPLVLEMFSAPEAQLSFIDIVKVLKFSELFDIDRLHEHWPTVNNCTKRALAGEAQKNTELMVEAAEVHARALSCDKARDLEQQLTRYIVTTSSKCLLKLESTDTLCESFIYQQTFAKLLILSTYMFPNWVAGHLAKLVGQQVTKFGDQFLPQIEKYFQDPKYSEATLFRLLVDTGNLSSRDLKNLVLLFAGKASDNPLNLLRNSLLDLAAHPLWLAKLRAECAEHVDGFQITNPKPLLQSKLLHACCLESARLNSNVILSKRIANPHSTLGGYHVGHAHEVVPCAMFFMSHESDYYKDTLVYNPDRFLSGGEKHTTNYILSWGTGTHRCPGKEFSLNLIKFFLALVVTNFEVNVKSEVNPKPNQFNYSFLGMPFITRKLDIQLDRIN